MFFRITKEAIIWFLERVFITVFIRKYRKEFKAIAVEFVIKKEMATPEIASNLGSRVD
jgi:hypothetical protein